MKSKGFNLYYLSNWDRYSYDLEEEFFDTLLDDRFTGGLFSFDGDKAKGAVCFPF